MLANGFSYLMNSLWSFQTRVSSQRFGRFVSVSLIGLTLTLVISGIFDWQGYPAAYSIIVVVLTLPVLSFLAHNFWTFRQ